MGDKQVQVSFHMSAEHATLMEAAKAEYRSLAAEVRRIIEQHIEQHLASDSRGRKGAMRTT